MKSSHKIIGSLAIFSLMISGAASAQSATTKGISEGQNGKTISIKSGTNLTISLHSTYWDSAQSKNLVEIKPNEISAVDAGPTAAPGCQHPGSGCGVVKWFFKANKKGLASFTATRTSCGEAMQCTAENATYKVKFLVK